MDSNSSNFQKKTNELNPVEYNNYCIYPINPTPSYCGMASAVV